MACHQCRANIFCLVLQADDTKAPEAHFDGIISNPDAPLKTTSGWHVHLTSNFFIIVQNQNNTTVSWGFLPPQNRIGLGRGCCSGKTTTASE